MADVTPNLNLILPTEDEYYDIEVFNENFRKVDAHVPRFSRSYFSQTEPLDWTADDVWYQVFDITEKPDIIAALELVTYDENEKYMTELDGTLHTVANAAESETAANDGDIIIEI